MRGSLIVSVPVSSGLGSNPGRRYCVVFLGKALYLTRSQTFFSLSKSGGCARVEGKGEEKKESGRVWNEGSSPCFAHAPHILFPFYPLSLWLRSTWLNKLFTSHYKILQICSGCMTPYLQRWTIIIDYLQLAVARKSTGCLLENRGPHCKN